MLKLRCDKHPRYDGVKPPRAACAICIVMYEAALKLQANGVKVNPKPRVRRIPTEASEV